MMRRGGRKGNVPAPWRRHDNAIPSAVHLDRGWAARNYVKVVVLAACSIAISIIIWRLGRGRGAGPGVVGDHLESRDSGFVFPLYRYYQQFPNGSHVVGGRGRWRSSRAGFHGRVVKAVRSKEPNPLFDLRGGQRISNREIEQFYVEMKLGDPPKPFRFHVDTGSGWMWVYCTESDFESFIDNVGPHGMFGPGGDSYVKCIGETASICKALQAATELDCNRRLGYKCLFSATYFDDSHFLGHFVNESITVTTQNKAERTVFALFGCVLEKVLEIQEQLPLTTDGMIGLGHCKGSLMDQLSTSKAIGQNVLGICLEKSVDWNIQPSRRGAPGRPVGYISMGMDFEKKFDQSKSVWVKLTNPGPGILCAYAAKLLYIFIGDRRIKVQITDRTVGMSVALDTGSDLTFFHKDVYDQVLYALQTHATNRDYFRVGDDDDYEPSAQRACWEVPAKRRKHDGNPRVRTSPIHDYEPLKLGFEGIASATEPAPVHYLTIQAANYLTWDADMRKLCLNILEDPGTQVYNLGVEGMREHLFVFDIENERFRWKESSNCKVYHG